MKAQPTSAEPRRITGGNFKQIHTTCPRCGRPLELQAGEECSPAAAQRLAALCACERCAAPAGSLVTRERRAIAVAILPFVKLWKTSPARRVVRSFLALAKSGQAPTRQAGGDVETIIAGVIAGVPAKGGAR